MFWSEGFCDYLDRLREQNERKVTTDRNEEEEVEQRTPLALRRWIDEHSERLERTTTCTDNEFFELSWIVEPKLTQAGTAQRMTMEPIHWCFITRLWLVITLQSELITELLKILKVSIWRFVHFCLDRIGKPLLARYMPFTNGPDVRPVQAFGEHSHAFAPIDASVILINHPKVGQQDYYSGKTKRYSVKIQELVTAYGQPVHLSKID
jgi:hypothetical protein